MESEREAKGKKLVYLTVISSFLSMISFFYFYSQGTTTTFLGASLYLNQARWIYNSLISFSIQEGEMSLPLFPLLMLPFIWNDFLYYSGIAGSLVSISFYILGSILIYKFSLLLSHHDGTSFMTTLLFLTNPLVLYTQSIPLPLMFLAFLVTSSFYFLVKWIKTDRFHYLVFAAAISFLATLTGYEGWLFTLAQTLIIIGVCLAKGYWYKKTESLLILYNIPPLVGIALWLSYGAVVFGDSFYFIHHLFSRGISLKYLLFPSFLTIPGLSLYGLIIGVLSLSWLIKGKWATVFLVAVVVLQLFSFPLAAEKIPHFLYLVSP